jgi:citrate lyase beta subunit
MKGVRSLLFVPANRPERFAKALTTGADCVCIDLEDAVPLAEKAAAREIVASTLPQLRQHRIPVGVRITAVGSTSWQLDLAAVGVLSHFVMVPKVRSAAELAAVVARVPAQTQLWPLIETADGLRGCWDIAAADRVCGVLFGAHDYAADVGCDPSWEPLLFARSQLAAACAAARVELLDSPSGDLRGFTGLVESSRRAKALGYTGRACIHPDQVGPVNEMFSPSAAEVEQARRVLAAFETSAGAAAQLDGQLIELPVAIAARRILARIGG